MLKLADWLIESIAAILDEMEQKEGDCRRKRSKTMDEVKPVGNIKSCEFSAVKSGAKGSPSFT